MKMVVVMMTLRVVMMMTTLRVVMMMMKRTRKRRDCPSVDLL